ncbi:MAG: NAD(P)-binding domain-containing protein [Deltaproteobacteria bacterium]|nr:NAD(P)-binding domain-containing protein [Deltaproteobacteria bacterium]MBK8238427.1 NAD(P)-binding domain-containing protein [Deltaproteobacteria bacterium]MBP7286134.1 NAD(P)-binding domain-containing protein [Nannocystaceae bacterium]
MQIGILGTGMVGNAIASKLVACGHEVTMGSRSATNEKALAWVQQTGARAHAGSFAQAAGFGELVFVCTAGAGTLEALQAAGADALGSKIVIDVSNPLDFSRGMPPRLSVCNDDSLGEQVQRAFPAARVVKTLNTINCNLMIDASRVPGEHAVFVAGNDAGAKASVELLLRRDFGWRHVVDLGDITGARATEMYLPLWLRLWGALGTADFNVGITRAG